MKRNALIAVVITAAATLALGGPAFAKSGHGNGGSNGGGHGAETSAKPPKPTIHPNQAVKDAIHCAFHCGTIEDGRRDRRRQLIRSVQIRPGAPVRGAAGSPESIIRSAGAISVGGAA